MWPPVGASLRGKHAAVCRYVTTALSDRSIAHVVMAADDEEAVDVDFDVDKCSDDMKARINMLRVCSCLTAYVLVFIKRRRARHD